MGENLTKGYNMFAKKISRIARQEWNSRLRGEIGRTISTALVLGIMVVIMTTAQVYSDYCYGDYVRRFEVAIHDQGGSFPPSGVPYYAQVPLHDRGFLVFPDYSSMRSWLPDLFLTSLLGITIVFNVFWIHRPRMEYQGFVVARRMLWMLATLYFFRTWSFLVTTVPSPLRGCTGRYLPDDLPTKDMVPGYVKLIGQMATGSVTACTDNIYSGHTSLVTILVMTSMMYSGLNWFKVYSLLHGFSALLLILVTRLHYTVDVYIALLVASFVFLNYHFLLIIFLDRRLQRYHAIKLDKIAQLDTFLQKDSESLLNAPNDQVAFNKRIIEEQIYQDVSWLKEEVRIVWRVIWLPLGRLIWWMDGMDLRRPVMDPSSINVPTSEKEDREEQQ